MKQVEISSLVWSLQPYLQATGWDLRVFHTRLPRGPSGSESTESACQRRRRKRRRFDPWVWKIPWRRAWQSPLVFLPGESHRQRSLACYSPWGCRELDTTERLDNNTFLLVPKLQVKGRKIILHSVIQKGKYLAQGYSASLNKLELRLNNFGLFTSELHVLHLY